MIDRFGVAGELSDDARLLLDLLATAGAAPDLPSLLSSLVGHMRAFVGAEYAGIATLGPDGELRELVADGVPVETVREAVSAGAGVLGRVLAAEEPVRLDVEVDGPIELPRGHPAARTLLGVPIVAAGQSCGLVYAANKADGPFTEVDQRLVDAAVGKALSAPIVHARAQEESERRRLWLEALTRVSSAVATRVLRSDTLSEMVENVRQVTGAAVAAMVDGGRSLEISALAGDAELAVRTVQELRELIIETGSVARVTRVPRRAGSDTFLVPLRTQVAPAGVLLIEYAGAKSHLTGFEDDLVVMFAEQAGLAIDRVYAVEHRHQAVLTSDRERIARDLHDLVIQRLFATGLHLQGARPVAPPAVQERIDRAVADLDASIRDIRSSIFELNHGAKGPLRQRVQEVIADYVPVLGFAPVLRCSGPVTLAIDSAGADNAVAVLREALSNVVRHAEATSVYVELEADEESLVLRVSDDGRGLPEGLEENRSGGLVNARQRATAMRGSLEVRPRQPRGACVVWRVPVAQ